MLFVTTGWLLRLMLHQRSFLKRCTHIILDEVFSLFVYFSLFFMFFIYFSVIYLFIGLKNSELMISFSLIFFLSSFSFLFRFRFMKDH